MYCEFLIFDMILNEVWHVQCHTCDNVDLIIWTLNWTILASLAQNPVKGGHTTRASYIELAGKFCYSINITSKLVKSRVIPGGFLCLKMAYYTVYNMYMVQRFQW